MKPALGTDEDDGELPLLICRELGGGTIQLAARGGYQLGNQADWRNVGAD